MERGRCDISEDLELLNVTPPAKCFSVSLFFSFTVHPSKHHLSAVTQKSNKNNNHNILVHFYYNFHFCCCCGKVPRKRQRRQMGNKRVDPKVVAAHNVTAKDFVLRPVVVIIISIIGDTDIYVPPSDINRRL